MTDPSKMDKRTKEYKDWAAGQQKEDPVGKALAAAAAASPGNTGVSMVSSPATAEKAEARKPTRPWEKNDRARPWRRNYFNLEKTRPGFKPRFVDPTKVEGRIQRGYVIANPEDYGGLVDIDIRESKGLGHYISRQGMILMEIPEEGHKAYADQQEQFIRQQYKTLRKNVKEEAKKAGFEMEVQDVGLK